jgi:hypothetical protein
MDAPLQLECSRVWEQVQWVDQDEEVLAVAQVLEGLVRELAELVLVPEESVSLSAVSVLWLAQSVSQLVWPIP